MDPRAERLLEVSICARAPSPVPCAILAVVQAEHVVVHVEVLRVGSSRHQQEHLAELERVGLALHLKYGPNKRHSSSHNVPMSAHPFHALAVAAAGCSRPPFHPAPMFPSRDLEVAGDKDEDSGRGLGAVDGLDCVLDGLERQADELLNDGLRAAERLALERKQRGGLLKAEMTEREERREGGGGESNGSTGIHRAAASIPVSLLFES